MSYPTLDEPSGAGQGLGDSLLPLLPDLKFHEARLQPQTRNHHSGMEGETEAQGSGVSCLPHFQLRGGPGALSLA